MPGYDSRFLSVGVPLPGTRRPIVELAYVHFTVLLDPERRLAALTAVNIDGASLVDLGRGDDWHLDDRVPAASQAGPELYRSNDLDRGHLVRRRDPVWGLPEDAARANFDTFSYANAAPQAAKFNQGEDLWVGLEDHVLGYAGANRLRVSVFTGPVLRPNDPVYRGVGIPRLFWKIAAWTTGYAELAAAGFMLDQSPQLDELELPSVVADPPPLGPFRTFQLPISEIAGRTGLSMAQLVDADRLPPATDAFPPKPRDRWVALTSFEQVRL